MLAHIGKHIYEVILAFGLVRIPEGIFFQLTKNGLIYNNNSDLCMPLAYAGQLSIILLMYIY